MRPTKILHTCVQNLKILKAKIELSVTSQHLTSCERDNSYTMFALTFDRYRKAFLMSHSLQTVNLFCTLFFCLFRPDRSSRL